MWNGVQKKLSVLVTCDDEIHGRMGTVSHSLTGATLPLNCINWFIWKKGKWQNIKKRHNELIVHIIISDLQGVCQNNNAERMTEKDKMTLTLSMW